MTANLSPSEERILAALLQGQHRKAIASALVVSLKTIDSHIEHARRKLSDLGLELVTIHTIRRIPNA